MPTALTNDMTDRRKATTTDAIQESDRQFLERTGVNVQMKDVLIKVIENRPEDPVTFLSDYFETLGDKVDRVAKAHQQICLTHHSKPAFSTNVWIAYDMLSQSKANGGQLKGVTGTVFTELLQLLCRDFPQTVRDKLLRKIYCRDYEVIKFQIFKSGVFTCLVLQDFIKQSQSLFHTLDKENKGKVDRVLCETVNRQLLESVVQSAGDPETILQAGYILSPEKLSESLTQALFQGGKSKLTMTEEEFVSHAANAFLIKVEVLR